MQVINEEDPIPCHDRNMPLLLLRRLFPLALGFNKWRLESSLIAYNHYIWIVERARRRTADAPTIK